MAFPKRQLAAEPFGDQQRAIIISLSQRPPAPVLKMTGLRGYRGGSAVTGAHPGGYGGINHHGTTPPVARVDIARGWALALVLPPMLLTVPTLAPRGPLPPTAAVAAPGGFSGATAGSKDRFDPFRPFESFATPLALPTLALFDRRASIWNSPVKGDNRVW